MGDESWTDYCCQRDNKRRGKKYHYFWGNTLRGKQAVILNQIENELQETVHSATNTLVIYMEQIEAAFRQAGVTACQVHILSFFERC